MTIHHSPKSDGYDLVADRLQEYLDKIDVVTSKAEEEHAALGRDLTTVVAELARLENRRREIRVLMDEIESSKRAGVELCTNDLFDHAFQTLERQSHSFQKRSTDNSRVLSAIEQRESLLASDPKIANKYARYLKMSEQLSEKIESVKDFPEYAQALRDTHNSIRESLAEILALDAEIESSESAKKSLGLEVLCFEDGDCIQLVMPGYANDMVSKFGHLSVTDLWLESTFNAFMVNDLAITDFEGTTWGPFISARVQSRVSWTNPETLATLGRSICSELNQLTKVDLRLQVRVTLVPAVLAPPDQRAVSGTEENRGQDQPANSEGREQVAGESEVGEEEGLSDGKWINGWVKRSDVREWRRKAPQSAASKWTPHARRVRTLLIRLIGHGAIGNDALVPTKDILEGLDGVDRTDLQVGIDQLIDFGILHVRSKNGTKGIGIAADKLEMAGDLINRDVTSEWERLLLNQRQSSSVGY